MLAVSSAVCLLISLQITMASCSANLYDIKRPMPLPAPVMMTILNEKKYEDMFYKKVTLCHEKHCNIVIKATERSNEIYAIN